MRLKIKTHSSIIPFKELGIWSVEGNKVEYPRVRSSQQNSLNKQVHTRSRNVFSSLATYFFHLSPHVKTSTALLRDGKGELGEQVVGSMCKGKASSA